MQAIENKFKGTQLYINNNNNNKNKKIIKMEKQ